MCGIVGYVGENDALRRVVSGLYFLEYRGYDSAGAAFFSGSEVRIIKTAGRVGALEEKLKKHPDAPSYCAIGHTRWATHGAPTEINAHPHKYGKVTIVHNGIIENARDLKAEFGLLPASETDTEIAAGVIDSYYSEYGDALAALRRACERFVGSYALAVMFDGLPDKIYAARSKSPLLVGFGDDGCFVASDTAAFGNVSFIELCDGDVCEISRGGASVYDKKGAPVHREQKTSESGFHADLPGIFGNYMRKEISDEPQAIKNTLLPRLDGGAVGFFYDGLDDETLRGINRISVVACGTAYHAGLMAKHYIEKTCRIHVDVFIASEFIYGNPIIAAGDFVLFITQSGETADTVNALRLSKSLGAATAALVNVKNSTAAREADFPVYTSAGREVAVASTKAYTVQCAALVALGARMAYAKGMMDREELCRVSRALCLDLPDAINDIISRESGIVAAAARFHMANDMFFIGRGADYCAVLEASLKLKEISYIHSEAYPAGELKHGTLSLITKSTPVVALMTDGSVCKKTMNSAVEAAARGGDVFAVCTPDIPRDDAVKTRFEVPLCDSDILPIAAATAFQLFAYHVSLMRGCDVDKPRNLAKSVTVE